MILTKSPLNEPPKKVRLPLTNRLLLLLPGNSRRTLICCIICAEVGNRLSQKLEAADKKRVVVAYYGDIYGRVSSLGRIVGEVLNAHLANAGDAFEVVDRRHLEEVLKEREQYASGLFGSGRIVSAGKFLGADTVIIGTIAPLADSIHLFSKGIDAQTGQIIFSDMQPLPSSDETRQALKTGISGRDIFRNMPATARFNNVQTFSPDANTVRCRGYGTFRSIEHAQAKYCYQRPIGERSSLTCYRSGEKIRMSRFCDSDDEGYRILDTARLAEMGIDAR